jgi:SPP1 family predicted phage head-tail adaptor
MAKRTRIGHLNRRIEIEAPEASRSATGQELLVWRCVAALWAGIVPANTGSDEQVEGDQLVATTRVIFVIRYRPGIDKKMRVRYAGNLYNILIIQDDGTRTYLHLTTQIQE